MPESLLRVVPKILPKLDPDFRPPALGHLNFEKAARATGKAADFCLAIERNAGTIARFDSVCIPGSPDSLLYAEKILKFLLWQKGGFRVYVAAPKEVADHLKKAFAPGGSREFDAKFFAGVFGAKNFEVKPVASKARLPKENDKSKPIGRHLEGCRIGFDAGGSDRKVAAVIDGKEVFATETVWEPKVNDDWRYHVAGIEDSIRQAVAKMPRLDAIGVSSAGIYVDNEVRVASLFRKVQDNHPDDFKKHIVKVYIDLGKKFKVPVEVANDGDVTALAGAMSLKENAVLGIAMGTSEAAGYVDGKGYITGWLNELAFAPVDYSATAPADREWSGDLGTGVNYFSQEAVIRLAPKVGIELNASDAPGTKLKAVQDLFKKGDPRPRAIFETIGTYLGYALLQYAQFYELKQVLILGRVTSGEGGNIILEEARRVLAAEDPALSRRVGVNLPDEAARRVGQAIAAASLPEIRRGRPPVGPALRRAKPKTTAKAARPRVARPKAKRASRSGGASPRRQPRAKKKSPK